MRSASSSLAEGTIKINYERRPGESIGHFRNGQLDKAKEIYLELLKNDENNSSLLLLGTIYLQSKINNLSEKYFLKSLNNDPKSPRTLNNLGILKQTNDYKKSIEYFDLNIKLNNFLNSWVNKLNLLLETNKNKEWD